MDHNAVRSNESNGLGTLPRLARSLDMYIRDDFVSQGDAPRCLLHSLPPAEPPVT